VLTNDQSTQTRITLHDLINTIIIGFILVTVILMFFMGATNAIFVAMSVPLSMFLAFLIMPGIGFTMNMIVLFSFLMALGIVVDDAIVVIENTHRIYNNGKKNIVEAAKLAAGEVFLPVFSGTITTLAPFIPLAFWEGVIGEFMFFLPITLIITLMASLVVAYIINPVFAVQFMRPHAADENAKRRWTRGVRITTIFFGVVALIFYLMSVNYLISPPLPGVTQEMQKEMAMNRFGLGNLTVFLWLLYVLHHFVFVKWVEKFQKKVWPGAIEKYKNGLSWSLGRRWMILYSTIGLFVFSFIFFGIRGPKVVFFPQSDPNFTYIYVSLPIGTDQAYTNEVLQKVEARVNAILGKDNPLVSSVIANVTVGVTDPQMRTRVFTRTREGLPLHLFRLPTVTGSQRRRYLMPYKKILAPIKCRERKLLLRPSRRGRPFPSP
jgi:multidrug efflux pump